MKPGFGCLEEVQRGSPPMRGRGLKRFPEGSAVTAGASPPMRGRGLKHRGFKDLLSYEDVAPHAGAWIETGWS